MTTLHGFEVERDKMFKIGRKLIARRGLRWWRFRPLTSSPSASPPSNFRWRSSWLASCSSGLLSKLERLLLADDNVVSADQFLQTNSRADFIRFIDRGPNDDDEKGDSISSELQTAVVSYWTKFPHGSLLRKPFLQVDLFSTVHIGDKKYFETLQKELELYDCVLYEMVVTRESLESTTNSASLMKLKDLASRGYDAHECIQRQIASFLEVDFQIDCLDYQAENWYHADIDLETYDLLQQEKGESLSKSPKDLMLRWTKAFVQITSSPEDVGPLRSKASLPDYGVAMKVLLAKMLKSELTEVTADVDETSVIISERNRAAIEALRRAIDERHNKIAILYGVGHMPDLGRRLREDFGLVPFQVQWITAWLIRNYKLKTFQELDLCLSELLSGTLLSICR